MKKTKMNFAIEIVAVVISVIFVFPVLWLVLSSFKPGNELFTFPLTFFPKKTLLTPGRKWISCCT